MLHRRIAALGGRLLAQSHKRGADQRLQFRLSLDGQLIAQAANRVHQSAAVSAAVQFAQVRESDRRGPPRFWRFQPHAGSILHQDFVDGLEFTAPQHVFEESANVARRHAPCFVRSKHFFLILFGNLLPEFLVQQLGIRLHGQPRLRHHLFLRGKDLPQPFNFRIHAVQQLFHSVDAQFAFFVAVQREADGHVFRQFEQHRLVWLGIWRLRRESRQRLLQRILRPHRHGAQARLERRHVHAVLRIFPRFAQLCEQSEH